VTTAARLESIAGPAARIEARWLVEAAAGDVAALEAFIARRLAGEPVDRILGRRGFWTLDLAVRPDVLSPRSDTETLVRTALDRALALRPRDWPWRILDLGVGSGAILLALLAELPMATGLGIDVSGAALDAARANAESTGLATRASFRLGDWTQGLAEGGLAEGGLAEGGLTDGGFDIAVSNPPYIPTAAIAGLDKEVRDHDPALALDGGEDGLACYRALLPGLARALSPDGFAVLEFGDGQEAAVTALAAAAGLAALALHDDLGGLPRAVILNRMLPILIKAS